uniref:Uncharacterized protein n=1 Tax=Panthera leo TaxID=9689 RepID=A0A8C9DAR9_PANLE
MNLLYFIYSLKVILVASSFCNYEYSSYKNSHADKNAVFMISLFLLLFFGIMYIQEFYELTLLNSQKSCDQKIEEANQVAQKWEKASLLAPCHENLQKSGEVYTETSKRTKEYYPLLIPVKWSQS